MADKHEVFDVLVIGGGISGLMAAWRLRNHKVLLLEASERCGGRIKSVRGPDYWVNLGAQVFPHDETAVGEVAREFGISARPISGSLRGCAIDGRIYDLSRARSALFSLPLSLQERIAIGRVGAKLTWDAWHFARMERKALVSEADRAEQRRRMIAFENTRTFSEYLGPLPARVEPIFRSLARRCGGEPDQVAAGTAITCAAHVFITKGAAGVTARSVIGGMEEVPRALATALEARVVLTAHVTDVRDTGTDVAVIYEKGGERHEVRGRYALVATPAFTAREIIRELPPELDRALASVTYGAFVSMGVFTTETQPTRLDPFYAVATPGLAFDFIFNHAQVLRGTPRQPGGSLMVYRSGSRAAELSRDHDAAIEKQFVDDICSLVPELRGHIAETIVQRWPQGAAYASPGRAEHQAALERGIPGSRIALAGDYFDPLSGMEQAAGAAVRAADGIERRLNPTKAPGLATAL